jgi:hypothetical protein
MGRLSRIPLECWSEASSSPDDVRASRRFRTGGHPRPRAARLTPPPFLQEFKGLGLFILKGPAASYTLRTSYFLASRIRLNGVSVARRNRENPASANTRASRASPAWAPSARPTSCEREFGVQTMVDAA